MRTPFLRRPRPRRGVSGRYSTAHAPGPLPPQERSPALTHAEASRRETRRPPSSLRRLRCGVGLRVHRRSQYPPARRIALSLRANGSPPNTHGHGLTLRGACMRTPYRDRHRPAARRCGLILESARAAGLDGRCQSLRLVAAARHPDRYGLRRFACRSGVSSASAPARRVAGSLRASALDSAFHHPQRVAHRRSRRSLRRTTRGARASPGAAARGGPCA